ncbi:MFS transporter [Micromonospora sp. NPDC005305]|uniref:MFS transporter n=1 Tax=Micromonospora sp. NPDC005305 TaxID=3156875 RepID=UPI0033BF75C8
MTATRVRRGRSLSLTSYRELLRVPEVGRMLLASLAAKLPPTMLNLSLLLFLSPRYGYVVGGLATGFMAVGQGLSAPVRGRLMDRVPYRSVLLGCLLVNVAGVAALLAVASIDGPKPAVLALAALTGLSVPPTGIMMRTLWRSLAGEQRLVTAMALDATTSDLAHVGGPMLAAFLCLTITSVSTIAITIVLTVVAAILVLTLRVASATSPPAPAAVADRPRLHWMGPLRSAALRRLLLVHATFSALITGVDVVIVLINGLRHTQAYAGVQIGALSIGSIVGSLVIGAMPGFLARGPKLSVLLGVFAVGVAVLGAAAEISPLAMTLACPITGLAYGSTFATLFTMGGDLAPEGTATETQAWLSSILQAGSAVGAWFAVAVSTRTALALIPVIALAAAALCWRMRPRFA